MLSHPNFGLKGVEENWVIEDVQHSLPVSTPAKTNPRDWQAAAHVEAVTPRGTLTGLMSVLAETESLCIGLSQTTFGTK